VSHSWITPVVPKLPDILKHISHLLSNATGDGILEDFAINALEATRHSMNLPPQSRKFIPAYKASIAEQILSRLNL
jgi:hypothetical protein